VLPALAQACSGIMVNATFHHPVPGIRWRPLALRDHAAAAALLNKGFGARHRRSFWHGLLDRLASRPVPAGLPNYGYLLESSGRPVGILLLIVAAHRGNSGAQTIRCNVSSWYVEPAFRVYASLPPAGLFRHETLTYLNVSPAPNTRPIIEAQGWTRYSDGLFVAVPALQWRARGDLPAKIIAADREPDSQHADFERDLLVRHAAYGCVSFWCATAGRAYPFVFRRRLARGFLPCAQLIYCLDITDLVRFAGPIGRHLLEQGCPFVVLDAKGRVPGLLGAYANGLMPKYFKGPNPPRLGDLADTEAAMFGI
jgi:hypothetical protein